MRTFLSLLVFLLLFASSFTAQARKLFVVSVGIDAYMYATQLPNCENDARDMASLFRRHTNAITLVTGKAATRTGIVDALATFRQAGPDDVVLFYFSGHGVEGGLCPIDMGGPSRNAPLEYTTLQSAMRNSRAARKIMIIDACYSGGLRQSNKLRSVARASHSGDDKAEVVLFLSSRGNELSAASRNMRNSLFTHYLLRGLKGGADADHDRIVTASEIYAFVKVRFVQAAGKKAQNPVMWGKFSNNMPIINWNPRR